MLQKISLKEAAAILDRKDTRTAETFCEENNIMIFRGNKIKRPYIIKTEFEYAWEKDIREYFKLKYPNNWLQTYKAHRDQILLAEFMEQNERRRA